MDGNYYWTDEKCPRCEEVNKIGFDSKESADRFKDHPLLCEICRDWEKKREKAERAVDEAWEKNR